MKKEHIYIKPIKTNRFYYNVEINFLYLIWLLFIKQPFRPAFHSNHSKIQQRIKAWIDFQLQLYKLGLRILYRFIKCRQKIIKPYHCICLPFYGQLCFQTHRSFRIFDLKANETYKIFDRDTDISIIKKEIQDLKYVSKYDFTPTIKTWSIQQRWFKESFLIGKSDWSRIPRNSEKILFKFYNEVSPLLEKFILIKEPKGIIIKNYINSFPKLLTLDKSTLPDKITNDIQTLIKFFDKIDICLNENSNIKFYLIFSHGDFCPANMINTKKGLKILDWESVRYRSVLFDFYSYFFYRAAHQHLEISNLYRELPKALTFFTSRIHLKNSTLAENLLMHAKIYRYLYYFERIQMLTERSETDNNLNIETFLKNFILAIYEFEAAVMLE